MHFMYDSIIDIQTNTHRIKLLIKIPKMFINYYTYLKCNKEMNHTQPSIVPK